jgi:phosphomannomutase/phosphoglucomutase
VSIYKPCDIRGSAEEDLSPGLYRTWGQVLGAWAVPGKEFAIGGDVRTSTPEFLAALGKGLAEAGCRVRSLGIVPTPVVHFAARSGNAAGCAIVTASHSPADMNGLKWLIEGLPPTEKDVRKLEDETETTKAAREAGAGSVETADVWENYTNWLKETFSDTGGGEGVSVVVDPGNGSWAGRVAGCFREVFPSLAVTAIHDEPDGGFPNRRPDSAEPKNLRRLARAVKEQAAGLGVAFDGDGDRVSFVDGEGTILTPEEAVIVLAGTFGEQLRGRPFVYDLKFSDRVPERLTALGAEPRVERSGHAFIRRRMLKERALFGAEISGHFFYEELDGGDDGLFTACRLIRHFAGSGRNLADLRRECPPVFVTRDFRVPIPADRHEALLDEVRSVFSEFPHVTVDGIRVDFEEGWALIRSSVTGEGVTVRFEGRSGEDLDRVVQEFCGRVPVVGEPILDIYRPRGKS